MPKPWEYQTSSPHIAAVMQAHYYATEAVDNANLDVTDPDGFRQEIEDAVHTAADGVREAADGYTESADNMESGFGTATSTSDELREKGDALEDQACELENWTPDHDTPDPQDEGQSDEDYQEQVLDVWADDLRDEARSAIDEYCEMPY